MSASFESFYGYDVSGATGTADTFDTSTTSITSITSDTSDMSAMSDITGTSSASHSEDTTDSKAKSEFDINDVVTPSDLKPTIILVDFMNLLLKTLPKESRRINSVAELKDITLQVVNYLKTLGDPDKIYMVTKYFSINKQISYKELAKEILKCICGEFPELAEKICLVIVNGKNDTDKAADDRALFILCKEFQTTNTRMAIVSCDNFADINDHICCPVVMNFYCAYQTKRAGHFSILLKRTNQFQLSHRRQICGTYYVIHPNLDSRGITSVQEIKLY